MKKARLILTASMLTIFGFTAVTMTSCNKDETCAIGYEGKDCKELTRDKFLGTFSGNETCTIGSDEYTVTITEHSNDIQVNMSNIYNDNYTAIGKVTGTNEISFSGNGNGGVTTFSGTGTIVGNTLTLDYSIGDGVTENDCKFIGTK